MQRNCDACGDSFEAKRATARFCSPKCRKRNARRPDAPPKSATVLSIVDLERGTVEFRTRDDDAAPEVPPAQTEGAATAATRKQLEDAGRLDTALGVAALIAARQLDEVALGRLRMGETGSGVKALLEAHRTALAEAVKDAKTAEDPLSKIRAAAALKLVQGGRS